MIKVEIEIFSKRGLNKNSTLKFGLYEFGRVIKGGQAFIRLKLSKGNVSWVDGNLILFFYV
jgi:hypothetical protein